MLRKIYTILILITPILIYFAYITLYANNLPFDDDLPAILDFINNVFPISLQKWKLFFIPFREHVMVQTKIVSLLQYLLVGEVNFKILVLLGNCLWIGVLYYIYKIFEKLKFPIFYFLPIPFILFQIQFAETAFWSMAIWSNLAIILTVIICFYQLSFQPNKYWFVGGACMAVLATFTNGNGIVSFAIGFTILLINQSDKRKLIAWLIIGIITFSFYWTFRQYNQIKSNYVPVLNPLQIVLGVCTFIGSYFDFVSGRLKWLAMGMGAGMIGVVGYWIWKKYKDLANNPHQILLLAIASFIIITATATAVFRLSKDGRNAMLLGHYRHYSALIVSLTYLLCIQLFRKSQLVLITMLFVSSTVFVISYYRDIGYRYISRGQQIADLYNSKYNNILYVGLKEPMPLQDYYITSIKNNIFKPAIAGLFNKPLTTNNIDSVFAETERISKDDELQCAHWIGVSVPNLVYKISNNESWLWSVENQSDTYLFGATARKANIAAWKNEIQYFSAGMEGELPLCQLKHGKYQIYLIKTIDNEVINKYNTHQVVNVKE